MATLRIDEPQDRLVDEIDADHDQGRVIDERGHDRDLDAPRVRHLAEYRDALNQLATVYSARVAPVMRRGSRSLRVGSSNLPPSSGADRLQVRR